MFVVLFPTWNNCAGKPWIQPPKAGIAPADYIRVNDAGMDQDIS